MLAALLAPLVLGGGAWLASGLQPAGYEPARDSLTLLTGDGTPHRWIAVATFVATGLLVLLTGLTLPGRTRSSAIVLTGAGAALVLVGVLPRGSDAGWSWAQGCCALVAAAGLALWPALGPRPASAPDRARDPDPVTADAEPPSWPLVRLAVSGVLVALFVGSAFAARGDQSYGSLERLAVLAALGWIAVAAVRGWWLAGHRLASAHVRQVSALSVASLWCALAGILATVLAPVTASTTNFQARISLSPDPRDSAQVVVESVLGDVQLDFAGVAPGLRVLPQVKAAITEAFARPGASVESLKPTAAEQDAAISGALAGLGLRFLVGALVAVAFVVLVRALWRRRRPGPRTLGIAGLAVLIAAALVGSSAAAVYRSATPTQIRATGLLGAVKDNAGLFDEAAARSSQVAPYLRNIVALSAALQERYQPTQLASERVLRVLVVSDIHAGNQYALMRSIIRDEEVDLVIDAGDLVNFGTPQEGTIAGLWRGIASLEVPYVFVRGNHDATSEADTALLDRLAEVPNVILLQPNNSQYREVNVAGITIAGFNDVRYFGDDGKGSAEKSRPPRERWLASFGQRPAVDVVVSHEPWAVQGIPRAGVLINGHMHTAYREGNRLQAGTFTGGGPLTHFVSGQGSEELVGQPSAFDLLDFGPTCRLSAVRRYRYTNVIEGRPAFDDVSLVNGAAVDTRPADPLRSCSADRPLRVITVAAATVD